MKSMLSKVFVVPALAALLYGGMGIASAEAFQGGPGDDSESASLFDSFGSDDESMGDEQGDDESMGDEQGDDESAGDEQGDDESAGDEQGDDDQDQSGDDEGGDEGGEDMFGGE